jgi:hypothetical protein
MEMSQASKQKRGLSGQANAKDNPFRINGGGCYPLYFRGILGNLAKEIGKPLK